MASTVHSIFEAPDIAKSTDSSSLTRPSNSYLLETARQATLKSSENLISPSLKASINFSIDNLTQKLSNIYSSEFSGSTLKISQVPSPEAHFQEEANSLMDLNYEDTSKNTLLAWLDKIELTSVYPFLVSQGYDDLNFLIEQMRTEPLTLEVLKKIGIQKLGSRMVLLAHLEEETEKYFRSSCSIKFSCCNNYSIEPTVGLKEWLQKINLVDCHKLLTENGFGNLDQMKYVMNSNYPITDEVLQSIGVSKLGYRQRLLSKLEEEAFGRNYFNNQETENGLVICGYCAIV